MKRILLYKDLAKLRKNLAELQFPFLKISKVFFIIYYSFFGKVYSLLKI